jgi:hypothetical protein
LGTAKSPNVFPQCRMSLLARSITYDAAIRLLLGVRVMAAAELFDLYNGTFLKRYSSDQNYKYRAFCKPPAPRDRREVVDIEHRPYRTLKVTFVWPRNRG